MQNNPMQMLQAMMGNPAQVQQRFNSFTNGIKGDPQQLVMQQIRSGKITQQQLNMAQQMAGPIMQMLNIK